jgi:hypothetical protein
MSLIEALSACTSPLMTARVFDPLSPVYYRADEMADKQKAAAALETPAVKVTLSDTAKAKLAA